MKELLREAKKLLETAPIAGGSTISNPMWREWVDNRKTVLKKIDDYLQTHQEMWSDENIHEFENLL